MFSQAVWNSFVLFVIRYTKRLKLKFGAGHFDDQFNHYSFSIILEVLVVILEIVSFVTFSTYIKNQQNNPGQLSFGRYKILKNMSEDSNKYSFRLSDAQTNHMVGCFYSHSTWYYTITKSFCKGWLITYKQHQSQLIQIFYMMQSRFSLRSFFHDAKFF